MKTINNYSLRTPEEVAQSLADRVRARRLMRKWKQSTLAQHAGVSLASLRRFEQSGQISLKSLLRLAFALGRLDDFENLLVPPKADSIAALEAAIDPPSPKRGST